MPTVRKPRSSRKPAPAADERRGIMMYLADSDLARLDAIQAANPDLDSRSATVRFLARQYTARCAGHNHKERDGR